MGKFLITLFLGWAGVHKFIEKKTGMEMVVMIVEGSSNKEDALEKLKILTILNIK